MNPLLEAAVVAVICAAALAFIVVRIIGIIRGRNRSCCSGPAAKGSSEKGHSSCPHCSGCGGAG